MIWEKVAEIARDSSDSGTPNGDGAPNGSSDDISNDDNPVPATG